MKCEFCVGTGRVARIRNGSRVDTVTCPSCVRGIRVLGTHEALKDFRGGIHQPGEVVPLLGVEFVRPWGIESTN